MTRLSLKACHLEQAETVLPGWYDLRSAEQTKPMHRPEEAKKGRTPGSYMALLRLNLGWCGLGEGLEHQLLLPVRGRRSHLLCRNLPLSCQRDLIQNRFAFHYQQISGPEQTRHQVHVRLRVPLVLRSQCGLWLRYSSELSNLSSPSFVVFFWQWKVEMRHFHLLGRYLFRLADVLDWSCLHAASSCGQD